MSGPADNPTPTTAPDTPRARPRSPAGKAAAMTALRFDSTMADPTACTIRTAISTHTFGAAAAARMPNANTSEPSVYTRFLPWTSPSQPSVGSRPKLVAQKATLTHRMVELPVSNASDSAGNDTPTMPPSSVDMSVPIDTTARIAHLPLALDAAWPAETSAMRPPGVRRGVRASVRARGRSG